MPKICKKCDKKFPYTVWIDDKQYSLRNRRYCLECSPFNQHNTRKLETTPKPKVPKKEFVCSLCSKKRNERTHGLICATCKAKERRVLFKQRIIDFFGGKCLVCGYNRCINAFHVHHLNSDNKKFTIFSGYSQIWDKIEEEIKKCVLLCGNCHSELHAGMISLPINID